MGTESETQETFKNETEELMYYKKQYESTMEELRKLHENFVEYKESSEDLENELESELKRAEEEAGAERAKNKKLMAEIEENKSLDQELKNKIRILETRNEELENSIRVYSETEKNLKEKLEQEIENVGILQGELEQVNGYKESIQRLHDQMKEMESEIEILRKEKDIVSQKVLEKESKSCQTDSVSEPCHLKDVVVEPKEELSNQILIFDNSPNNKDQIEEHEKNIHDGEKGKAEDSMDNDEIANDAESLHDKEGEEEDSNKDAKYEEIADIKESLLDELSEYSKTLPKLEFQLPRQSPVFINGRDSVLSSRSSVRSATDFSLLERVLSTANSLSQKLERCQQLGYKTIISV